MKEKHRRGKRGAKKKKNSDKDQDDSRRPEKEEESFVEEEQERDDGRDDVQQNHQSAGPGYSASVPSQPFYGLVPTDIRQYAMNVEILLDEQNFEDAEEQATFLGNIYRGFEDNELRLATDYDCSRILEKLLRLSDDFQLRVFMDRLTGRFADLFRHQYASHVCQTLLTVGADVVDRELRDASAEGPEPVAGEQGVLLPMQTLIVDMCAEIKDQVKSLAGDRYGSHIVRLLLNILVGDPLSEQSVVRSKKSKSFAQRHYQQPQTFGKPKTHQVPKSFLDAARDVVLAIFDGLNNDEMAKFALDPITSPVLQQVLNVASKITADSEVNGAAISNLAQRILGFDTAEQDETTRNPFVEKLLRDTVGSHLLQKIVVQLDAAAFRRLYLTYFRRRLEELALHPLANFVVQEVILGARTKVELDMMIEELGPVWPKLLFGTRAGVVVKTLEACLRLQSGFNEAAKWLQQAFDYGSTEARKDAVSLLMTMRKYSEAGIAPDLARSDFSLHGSLIVQHMFAFPVEASRVVVQSFSDLPAETLQHLATHAVGGRVVEAFITSPQVNLKIKKKLLRSYEGHFATLACDKYGSHIVDKLWSQVADIGDKEKIAEELLRSLGTLENSHHGKFIVRNCRLENFKREKDKWRQNQTGIDRRKDMFKDIIGSVNDGQATAKKDSEEKKDPLLESKHYDDTMRSLGFDSASNVGQQSSEPLSHKDKKEKKKSKRMKQVASDSIEALNLDSIVPADQQGGEDPSAPKARKPKKDVGLDMVLDAVVSSGKKRKSKGGDDQKKEKKAKTFMS